MWVDASVKMPAWQRRHSRRACLPDQARGASEEAPPARHGGRGTHAPWRSSRRNSYRDSRRNSVHKRPNPARRGPILPFVYTIAIPRPLTTYAHGATVYTNAPKRHRGAISTDLCTLLRRRPGGEAHAALAVTQPPTHTNSRSLLYLNSCARIYGKGVSVGGREADRPDWPFLPDGYSLGKAYVA